MNKATFDSFDLSNFGYRELLQLNELIQCYANDELPTGWEDNEVKAGYDPYNDVVFLMNGNYDRLIVAENPQGEKQAALWLFTPYYGNEGTIWELVEKIVNDEISWNEEDLEYLMNFTDEEQTAQLQQVLDEKEAMDKRAKQEAKG